ncbi:hypothetical protein IWX90DRAFT_244989 [Phyllosticta citrichinensis]|uniref:Zn(2)-C6 fungal-type domain-containing protein n=1 Tax=Phyllosticta citrichinensis TaxID=1130410 RepID=A0ABR1XQK0_9PEZI
MHTSSRADPPKRPERLRDSCNSCAQAKVRCTRDKPVCVRCATKSLRCDYSPSMRKGKQRTTGGSISGTKKTSSAGSLRKSPERMHDDQKSSFPGSQKRTSYHHFPPTDQKLRTPSPTIPWNDNVWSSAGVGGMSNDTFPGLFPQGVFAMPYIAPQPDFFPACDPLPNTFGNDSMNLDCAGIGAFADLSGYVGGDGAVSMGTMDDMDIAMLGNDNDSMAALGQLHRQEQQQWQADAYSHGSPSAMSNCSTSVGTPRTDESTLPHDCMAQALEMMAQVNSTPPEGASGVPLEFRILVRNKTIVDSIAQILQCGLCMQEMRTPHILTILTISLIASYHGVLQSFASDHSSSSSSDNSHSSSASSSTTTTPPPHPASTSLPQKVPNTTTTNTIAPALAALSGLGIDATTTTHGARNAPPVPGLLHCGAAHGPLPAPTISNPLMSMSSDAKSRMQIIFTELARVRTLVDAMADALRECGRAFDERAAAAQASNDDGNDCASGDGGSGARVGGGDAENLTHSAVLAQLEKVLRAKERSVFQAVVRAVR